MSNAKLLVVVNLKNRYRNALYFDGKLITTGNNGLEGVQVDWQGKNGLIQITLRNAMLLVESDDCPEESRYAQIHAERGNRDGLKSLNPACEMLRMSPNACDGCQKQPKTFRPLEDNIVVHGK